MNIPRSALREDLEAQFELPNLPPPMTANRAKDLHTCKRCQRPCGFCHVTKYDDTPDPLGR